MLNFLRKLFAKKPKPVPVKKTRDTPEMHKALQLAVNRAFRDYFERQRQMQIWYKNLTEERKNHGQKAVR